MPSGGSKAQRVKGNVKPSSSSRAAEFMHQDGQRGFVGFASLADNNYGYVPQPIGDETNANSELLMLMRKMTKKDTVTRLKAIQEFTLLCKEKDQSAVHGVLSYWPRIYVKISNDYDHRVREACQQAHHQITTKAGRKLAPYLKQIITPWLMSQHDTYIPAANVARSSFSEIFQGKKKGEVLIHCKNEIIENIHNNLMNETADTLSDPKMVPVEERESKYERFISSSLSSLDFFISNLMMEQLDESILQTIDELLANKKFWKFSQHKSSVIRGSFYQLMTSFLIHLSTCVNKYQKQFCVVVLTNFDEQDPLVVKSLWNAALVLFSKIEGCWDHVNPRKAVLPKIWKLLKHFCYGNASVVYPNLLPFLSKVSTNVIGDGIAFYEEFFGSLLEGIFYKQEKITVTDATQALKAFIECIEYLITQVSIINNNQVSNFLIENKISFCLERTFHSDVRYLWFGVFYKEFSKMLQRIATNSILKTNVWKVIENVIFSSYPHDDDDGDDDDNNIPPMKFKANSKQFFDSLLDFVYSLNTSEENDMKQTCEEKSLLSVNDDSQRKFVSCLIHCYVDAVFNVESSRVFIDFVNALFLLNNKDCLLIFAQCVMNENNLHTEGNITLIFRLIQEFFVPQLIKLPLEGKDKSTVAIFFLTYIHLVDQIDEYLSFLFDDVKFDNEMMLYLFCALFSFEEKEKIFNFLISNKVQTKLLTICQEDESGQLDAVKWNVLESYLTINKDNIDGFSSYVSKLLPDIQSYINDTDKNNLQDCLHCYNTLTKLSKEFTHEYFNTFDAIVSLCINNTNDIEKGAMVISSCIETCCVIILSNVDAREQLLKVVSNKLLTESKVFEKHKRIADLFERIMKISFDTTSSSLLFRTMFEDVSLDNFKKEEKENIAKYFISIIAILCKNHFKDLEDSSQEKMANLLLTCLFVPIEMDIVKNIEDVFQNTDEMFLQTAIEILMSRRGHLEEQSCSLAHFFMLMKDCNVLTDNIIDFSLNLSKPKGMVDFLMWMKDCNLDISIESSKAQDMLARDVDNYCTVISFVNDISTLRAMVERMVDEFNDEDSTANPVFAGFVKTLSTTLHQWYKVFTEESIKGCIDDYNSVITNVFKWLMQWKDVNNEQLLFGCVICSTNIDNIQLKLNISVMKLLQVIIETSACSLSSDDWDFLLCALISWMQTLDDLKDVHDIMKIKMMSSFYTEAFELMYSVSYMLEKKIADKYSTATTNIIDSFPAVSTSSTKSFNINFDITDQLSTEWKEFFSPSAFKSTLSIFLHDLEKGMVFGYSTSLCQSVCMISKERILESIYGDCIDDASKEKLLNEFFNKMFKLFDMKHSWCYQFATYHILQRFSVDLEMLLCETVQSKEESKEDIRKYPDHLFHQIMESNCDDVISYMSEENGSIDNPLNDIQYSVQPCLFTYMLSWFLMLNIFRAAIPDHRAKFANFLYEKNSINELMSIVFSFLPNKWKRSLKVTELNTESLQDLSCWLLSTVLECTPALVRSWYNNSVNRKRSLLVEKFISTNISPILLRKEFMNVEGSTSKEFDNMLIKTRPGIREIIAVYTVEEMSMELQVQLPNNYPLSPITVDCGKRIGVGNALWRQWMLQLTSFLSFQNGSIVEGLSLWKKNVDKRFEGVEECMVCFSIIHASNYSLPSIACKTCKKKFHPVCLYKWFNTSGKSTCPLCRNIF